MQRKDDKELVRVQLGELRRLQKLDREMQSMRARNQVLEDTFTRVQVMQAELGKLIARVLADAEYRRKESEKEENHATSH